LLSSATGRVASLFPQFPRIRIAFAAPAPVNTPAMTLPSDDTRTPDRGADIIPFPSRRPLTAPAPDPASPADDGEDDDDGPSAA